MTPNVKAQKTRLSNYLTKELGAKLYKAKTTESEYFKLGPIKIRISDHTNASNSLNILIPFNDPNTFIIENNYTISILKSLKEVKMLLQSLIFVNKICEKSLELDLQQELKDAKAKVDELSIENAKFESMITTRNNAINELSKRAKKAEEIVLNSNNSILLTGNVITLKGISYPMEQFPNNIITKIKNIMSNGGQKFVSL